MPLITITRSVGCGGTAIAKRVADGLDMTLYDDRAVEELADRTGLDEFRAGPLGERSPGLLDRLLSSRPQVYLDVVQSAVYAIARHGTGVILGHGGQTLLADFDCALHVRIHAPERVRIKHLVERHGLSEEAAARRVRRSDQEQRGFQRWAFQRDWNDLALYDLAIHRGKVSEDLAAELIVTAARSREIAECSADALERMERRSLARRVEAAVLEARFSLYDIHVEVPSVGVARLVGVAPDDRSKKRLLQAVAGDPAVSEVRDCVAVVPVRAD